MKIKYNNKIFGFGCQYKYKIKILKLKNNYKNKKYIIPLEKLINCRKKLYFLGIWVGYHG